MPPKFLISILGMNRVGGTMEAVEALLKSQEPFHLVLTNQNSTDGTGAYFDQIKNRHPERVTVFHEEQNSYFQAPNDRAFRMAARMECRYFVALNDDALIPPNGLTLLAEPLDASPMAALSGPQGGCQELSHELHGQHGNALHFIEGSCLCVKVEAVQRERRNLWDDHLKGIYFEDAELSLFMQERGYTIHKVPFDLPHARSSTVNRTAEIQAQCRAFQEANHTYGRKRFAYWIQHRRFDIPIVVKREYAIGDAILIEPIIRAIHKSRPLFPILIQTRFPELFANHPDVHQAAECIIAPNPHLLVDLDGAYEATTDMHYCEAYWQAAARVIIGLEPLELRTRLYPSPDDLAWAGKAIAGLGKKIVLLATDDTSWTSRNWPKDRMKKVAKWLIGDGWSVIAVGSKDREFAGSLPKVTNLVGQTSLMQLAALCSVAQMMVTVDTSTLHLAQAVGCPVVSLFGISFARYVTTQGSKCAAVECPPTLATAGIRHRVVGKTFLDVGTECMDAITVDQVIEGVRKLAA